VSDESWPRIKEILNRFLGAAPKEREAAIARECGEDEALRAEVESFLKYEESAAALLSPAAWREAASAPETAPERIGRYQVVHELGRGGVGTVYLAERDDGEYRQAVAVKVVGAGVDAALLGELFRHERQILARLKHPNIAHLMDGGTTEDGRPYFVMEYVEGAPLTPRYASPEQLRGEPLTTAIDIHSLGVILLEMLTGRTRGAIGDRDLEGIIERALAEDPAKRYSSVEALAADIERYLRGCPVQARRGGAWHRARKFAGRNRWTVGVAAAALLGIAAAFVVIWRVGSEAQMRFNQLRQFARAVVFEVYGEVEKLPGSTKAREMLVQKTLRSLQSLEAGSKGAALKWELAEAYAKIGDAQGNPAAANLGDTGAALESYGRAKAFLSELVAESPNDQRAIRSLADVEERIASLLETRGEREKAQVLYREAAALLERTRDFQAHSRRARRWRGRAGTWLTV
jgi:hypothetical protein